MGSGTFRLRIVYGKRGRLRWLSHLELTRSLERGIRRAALPYAVTLGFNPRMRIAFGPALPVGTGAEQECVDVWLREYVPAQDALSRVQASLPADLAPVRAVYVSDSEPSLSSGTHIGVYDVRVDGKEVRGDTILTALAKMRTAGELEVEHRGKTKVFDLARSLPKEARASELDGGVVVTLAVRMSPEGSLRPDVLLSHVLHAAGIQGAVAKVTRTDTLTELEEGAWSRPA